MHHFQVNVAFGIVFRFVESQVSPDFFKDHINSSLIRKQALAIGV
jgi:hypothetical protein